MKCHRHLLRDTFFLSLPIVALLGYVIAASIVSFYNAEIKNFHGYPIRPLRVGGLQRMLQYSVGPLRARVPHRYLADRTRRACQQSKATGPRVFDLRIQGRRLDALASAVPASTRQWQPAFLVEGQEFIRVEARNRGQQ